MNLSKHYLRNRVESSTPGELIVMLYDGLLRFTRETVDALALESPGGKAAGAISAARAIDILSALNSSLRFDVDPVFCERISGLYQFFMEQLSTAARTSDHKPAERIIPLIEDLRDAWASAVTQGHSGMPLSAAVA